MIHCLSSFLCNMKFVLTALLCYGPVCEYIYKVVRSLKMVGQDGHSQVTSWSLKSGDPINYWVYRLFQCPEMTPVVI